MVDLYGINLGKYTSPMDPMGFKVQVSNEKALSWHGKNETSVELFGGFTL